MNLAPTFNAAEKYLLSGQTLNELIRRVARLEAKLQDPGSGSRDTWLGALAKNGTGAVRQPGDVVQIEGPIFPPDGGHHWRMRPTFSAGVVSASYPQEGVRFGVYQYVCEINAYASVAIVGHAWVRISDSRETVGRMAEPVPGQTYLAQVAHGRFSILKIWGDAGGGLQWGLISLEEANYEEVVKVTGEIDNGYYPGAIQAWNSATESFVTIRTCKVKDLND